MIVIWFPSNYLSCLCCLVIDPQVYYHVFQNADIGRLLSVDGDVHHLYFKLTELSLIFPVVRLLAGEFGISDFYRILLSIISWKLLIQPLFPHSALIGCINNFTTWNFSNNIQISNWKFFFLGKKLKIIYYYIYVKIYL